MGRISLRLRRGGPPEVSEGSAEFPVVGKVQPREPEGSLVAKKAEGFPERVPAAPVAVKEELKAERVVAKRAAWMLTTMVTEWVVSLERIATIPILTFRPAVLTVLQETNRVALVYKTGRSNCVSMVTRPLKEWEAAKQASAVVWEAFGQAVWARFLQKKSSAITQITTAMARWTKVS